MHADAGDELEEVRDGVALAEAVPEERDRPELEEPVPSQMRWEWIRGSSESSVRIQVAFGGGSTPSFSIARTKASSLI